MFRMNGYVQDERYFAIEHMDVQREAFQSPTVYQLRMCGAKPLSLPRYINYICPAQSPLSLPRQSSQSSPRRTSNG